MDPISRKIKMKNVAGFHSFDFGFLIRRAAASGGSFSRRRGFGIRERQKED